MRKENRGFQLGVNSIKRISTFANSQDTSSTDLQLCYSLRVSGERGACSDFPRAVHPLGLAYIELCHSNPTNKTIWVIFFGSALSLKSINLLRQWTMKCIWPSHTNKIHFKHKCLFTQSFHLFNYNNPSTGICEHLTALHFRDVSLKSIQQDPELRIKPWVYIYISLSLISFFPPKLVGHEYVLLDMTSKLTKHLDSWCNVLKTQPIFSKFKWHVFNLTLLLYVNNTAVPKVHLPVFKHGSPPTETTFITLWVGFCSTNYLAAVNPSLQQLC